MTWKRGKEDAIKTHPFPGGAGDLPSKAPSFSLSFLALLLT